MAVLRDPVFTVWIFLLESASLCDAVLERRFSRRQRYTGWCFFGALALTRVQTRGFNDRRPSLRGSSTAGCRLSG
uniref:Putative secreted protein n=1 Tax=Anopheles darlingi TaxID=43151 RepID=A0A2M4DAE4_ANODA